MVNSYLKYLFNAVTAAGKRVLLKDVLLKENDIKPV